MLPWKRVAVELQLGLRVKADLAAVVSQLAVVLQSNNEFCESLRTAPAEVLARQDVIDAYIGASDDEPC